jgi:hypothetical protein
MSYCKDYYHYYQFVLYEGKSVLVRVFFVVRTRFIKTYYGS